MTKIKDIVSLRINSETCKLIRDIVYGRTSEDPEELVAAMTERIRCDMHAAMRLGRKLGEKNADSSS